jgi:hypothetical protein
MIIDLQEYRQARRPHEAGAASCGFCGHAWTAVAPAGTDKLKCPTCLRLAGEWDIAADGGLASWVCLCGCDLFKVRRDGIFCLQCGEEQVFS